LTDASGRGPLEVAERAADWEDSLEQVWARLSEDPLLRASILASPDQPVWCAAQLLTRHWDEPSDLGTDTSDGVLRVEGPQHAPEHAALLRDIFGLDFRPAPDPAPWLSWQGGTVARLAQAAYDERRLPEGHLDPARLAVLADALEDAGCADGDLLGHLRSPGPHVRGCWAVDILTGRE
jgi:hypothetical protein